MTAAFLLMLVVVCALFGGLAWLSSLVDRRNPRNRYVTPDGLAHRRRNIESRGRSVRAGIRQ